MRTEAALGGTPPKLFRGEFDRPPNDHEFYLMWVGTCTAELLTCCEQLDLAPHLLANYRETPAMRQRGVNRHSHMVFHVEGYLIRTQSLFDRCLRLVDAVFDLRNDPKNWREHIVPANFRVRRTAIPKLLRSIKKLLDRYARARIEIVHRGSIKDDQLHHLEMYYVLEEVERAEGKFRTFPDYANLRKELARQLVRSKKTEFLAFNAELTGALRPFLDALLPDFRMTENGLLLQLRKPPT